MTKIPAAEMAQYRAYAARRQAEANDRLRQRLSLAWTVAEEAAALLRATYAAREVIVFGSLTQPELFHVRSDVDLAAWGIDERRYYRAVADVNGISSQFSIDLIRMEETQPGLRAAIERTGITL